MKFIKSLHFFILPSVIDLYFCANFPPTNYAFLFPFKPHVAAAIYTNVPISKQTRELTVSMWINQFSKDNLNPYLSFAVPSQVNTIVYGPNVNKWWLHIYGQNVSFDQFVRLNEWVHYAITWESKDGGVSFYINGKLTHSEFYEHLKGITWNDEHGTLVLGQDQDSMGGGFEYNQSFRGEMTEVNIWNRVLDEYEVDRVFKSLMEGNIVSWSKTVWTLVNNISVIASTAHGMCPEIKPTFVGVQSHGIPMK